jgi:hypothetical protein
MLTNPDGEAFARYAQDPVRFRQEGGAYGRISADGGQVHHIPANEVSPLSEYSGPAIWMLPQDHQQTASWGSSRAAEVYRQQQAAHIRGGRYMAAVQMDVQDVRAKFGNKYDPAIEQMYHYIRQELPHLYAQQ